MVSTLLPCSSLPVRQDCLQESSPPPSPVESLWPWNPQCCAPPWPWAWLLRESHTRNMSSWPGFQRPLPQRSFSSPDPIWSTHGSPLQLGKSALGNQYAFWAPLRYRNATKQRIFRKKFDAVSVIIPITSARAGLFSGVTARRMEKGSFLPETLFTALNRVNSPRSRQTYTILVKRTGIPITMRSTGNGKKTRSLSIIRMATSAWAESLFAEPKTSRPIPTRWSRMSRATRNRNLPFQWPTPHQPSPSARNYKPAGISRFPRSSKVDPFAISFPLRKRARPLEPRNGSPSLTAAQTANYTWRVQGTTTAGYLKTVPWSLRRRFRNWPIGRLIPLWRQPLLTPANSTAEKTRQSPKAWFARPREGLSLWLLHQDTAPPPDRRKYWASSGSMD